MLPRVDLFRQVDPVMDADGNSYERSAIVDWLSRNHTSPVTRNPLRAEDLVPNRALRETIEAYQKNAKSTPPSSRPVSTASSTAATPALSTYVQIVVVVVFGLTSALEAVSRRSGRVSEDWDEGATFAPPCRVACGPVHVSRRRSLPLPRVITISVCF